MDIWIISTFWLLWIMLLLTFIYKYFYEHIFLFVLGIYLGVESLGHMAHSIFNILRNGLFSKVAVLFYILTDNIWGARSSPFLPTLISSVTLITVFLVDVKWYLIVVSHYSLICLSLMTNYVEHLLLWVLAILLLFNLLFTQKQNYSL